MHTRVIETLLTQTPQRNACLDSSLHPSSRQGLDSSPLLPTPKTSKGATCYGFIEQKTKNLAKAGSKLSTLYKLLDQTIVMAMASKQDSMAEEERRAIIVSIADSLVITSMCFCFD